MTAEQALKLADEFKSMGRYDIAIKLIDLQLEIYKQCMHEVLKVTANERNQ